MLVLGNQLRAPGLSARRPRPVHGQPRRFRQPPGGRAMTAPTTIAPAEPMTHRRTLEALSGLLLILFVALLSSTVVSTALPRIIGSLNGSQTQYTWVVTATLLTATATTPIWGKLA